jgi:hypothetical protein
MFDPIISKSALSMLIGRLNLVRPDFTREIRSGSAAATCQLPILPDGLIGSGQQGGYQAHHCADAKADNDFGDEFFNQDWHCSYSLLGAVSFEITAIS